MFRPAKGYQIQSTTMNELLVIMKQELLLTGTLLLVLVLKLLGRPASNSAWNGWMLFLLLLNLFAGIIWNLSGSLFGDMYVTDPSLVLQKNLLLLATLVIVSLSTPWLERHRHLPEFYLLLLSTLLGMCWMISSRNLLMFYLGLELATIPLAAMVNFDLGKRISSEAAMKMILSSALSSGLLLFGISLIYGASGTLSIGDAFPGGTSNPILTMGFLFFLSGFFFKLSVVPFQFWTPDVYEGAPIPVTAYLSVVSKGSIVFVLGSQLNNAFAAFSPVWYELVTWGAILTMTVGNLLAIRQDQLKRFLAFSSMAQVGYLLIGVSATSAAGDASVLYFLLVYLFSNLAAFGVLGLVSGSTGCERISDLRGFSRSHPYLAWSLAIALFSLAGIPPTAGFFGKFFLLTAGAAKGNYLIIVPAALNMIVSLYYYLRVIRAMFMERADRPLGVIESPRITHFALAVCLAMILFAGIASPVYNYFYKAANGI